MRRTFRRARSAAREQLKYIFARQPRRASDVLPSDSDFIDVNTLLTTLSVEDLNRTSEEYYRQHPDLVGTSADRSRLRTRAPASRVTTGRVRHVLFCDRRAPSRRVPDGLRSGE